MVNIDERFNIIKDKQDWQNMKLELYNVNIEHVENVIIKIYGDNYESRQECQKFYFEDNCIKIFFLLNNNVEVGDYEYDIVVNFKSGENIVPIYNRQYIVTK